MRDLPSLACVLASLTLAISPPSISAAPHLYLSAGGKVSVYDIDPDTGELSEQQALDLESSAGPQAVSPDHRFLYVASTVRDGDTQKSSPGIATLGVKQDGTLRLIHKAPIADGPSYLSVDATGRYLAGSHYGAGKATTWSLDGRGIYRGEVVSSLELEKCAHSAVFAPDNRHLFVPATGPNCIFQFNFDAETGNATANTPDRALGPQGETDAQQPRHLVFHPDLPIAYATHEREVPGVGVWSWDRETGRLKPIQNIPSTPPGFTGSITTADLHLTPDARFLYVSNRDLTDRKARTGNSSIVAFAVNSETGHLSLIDHFPSEHVPRSFCIEPSGRFLYVAGQMDHILGAYRIDSQTGRLTRIAQYPTGPNPSWVQVF